MTIQVKNKVNECKKLLNESDLEIQVKCLLQQLVSEIISHIKSGDWSLAVRMSYYCHEFGKLHGFTAWYPAYLEIRKTRDMIKTLSLKK